MVKVNITGDCYNGNEEWSTGFFMGSVEEGAGNFGVNPAWVESVKAAWETFFESAEAGVTLRYRTLQVKASIILATGKTDLGNIVSSNYAVPPVGASNFQYYPPQVTLVAQLAAANPRGLAGKGRMYLPGIAHGIDANGHVPTAACQSTANALRTFFDTIESAAGSPGYVMNASKGRVGVPFAPPVNQRVTSVRVGSVYDTQRRRRNGLTEQYASAVLAA
jgi:hypothetical protein